MFPALRYVTQGLKLIPHGILDQKIITERVIYWFTLTLTRGGSRAAATSKMECFVIIVNGCQPLTIITKRSILNVAAALDPPLLTIHCLCKSNQPLFVGNNVKERISRRVFQENKTHQVFAKTNIFYPPPSPIRTRNARFSEHLMCFVFLKHPFRDLPFCLMTDDFYS